MFGSIVVPQSAAALYIYREGWYYTFYNQKHVLNRPKTNWKVLLG